jgi:hypothetical protein
LKEFRDEVGFITGLEGDYEFSSAAIEKFCEDNNIRLDTSVAKEEHISNGLGIIDRLVELLICLLFLIHCLYVLLILSVLCPVISKYFSTSS